MLNMNWLMLGGGAAILVVAGAVAVAAMDTSGNGPGGGPTASATPGGGTRAGHGGRGSATLSLLRFDSDNDGRITRAEVEAGLLAQFRAIDTSHDGRIDAAEFQVYDAARRAERKARLAAWRVSNGASDAEQPAVDRTPFDSMKRLDWNLDGFVTPDEFGGRIRALAMRADRDGDGTIIVEELKAAGTARARRPQT